MLRRADLVLAPSPHDAALLATVVPSTRVLVRPPIAAAQPAAPPPLASRGGALVVTDHDVGWEGVLWLVARVWPRLRPAPHLKLLGRGWRGWVDEAGGAGEAGGGEEHPQHVHAHAHVELVALLRALQKQGGLTLLDAAAAESAAAWHALDGAAVLLLPQRQNETGHAAPSWGQPSAAVSAMGRGLPMVSTPAARPAGMERCGMSAIGEAAAFAAAVEDAATLEGWKRRSADARACARAHLRPASVELEWGTHLQRALSAAEAAGETQAVQ